MTDDLVSPVQAWLLQAALLEGEPARIAWQQWQAGADLDHLEPGAYWLMPLLYQSLRKLGVEHSWLPRLKGIYRHTWYANQTALDEISEVLRALHRAGVPTLILGAAAINLRFYGDRGLRPIAACEMGVPSAQVEAAHKALANASYTLQPPVPLQNERYRLWVSGARFRSSKGRWLTLRWHLVEERPINAADEEVWARAAASAVGDAPAYVLDAADQFWLACWPGPVALRAIQLADAYTILRSAPALDWARVLDLTRRLGAVLPVQVMLASLQTVLGMQVPSSVTNELSAIPVSKDERAEFLAHTLSTRSLFQKITRYRRRFECVKEGCVLRQGEAAFIEFLQHTWGLEHRWQVPLVALVHAARHLGATIFRRYSWRTCSGQVIAT